MMKIFVALCFGAFTFNYAGAQTFAAHSQLASAFATILGLQPQVEGVDIPFQNYVPFRVPNIRFMRGKSVMSISPQETAMDNSDDKKVLFLEGQTLRHERLLVEANKKRELAKKIKDAMERARGGEIVTSEVPAVTEGRQNHASEELREEEAFNDANAKLLEKQAELLENEAAEAERLIQSVKLNAEQKESQMDNCDILKIGPLKYSPQADELRHFIDSDTTGQITGNAFTIYYKKMPKITYFWEGIDPFIKDVADSPGCFELGYNGMPQVFCASGIPARNSWMDALAEGWFCNNMGIKGTLASIKAAEKAEKKIEQAPSPPPEKKKKEKKGLVDIEISVDENLKGHVKVNGKEHLGGEVKINGHKKNHKK